MSNRLRQFVDIVTTGANKGDVRGILDQIISEKAIDILEVKKVSVAKGFFGQNERKDE